MPPTTSEPARERYIISADDPQQLTDFLHSADPDIDIVDRIGPAGKPHTLIVTIPGDKAGFLAQRIRSTSQLTIEPDRPLSLFGTAGAH